MPQNSDEDNPMLPCEFCEGLIPMRKLLEHQVKYLKKIQIQIIQDPIKIVRKFQHYHPFSINRTKK